MVKPNRETLERAIERVTRAMTRLKNESFQEKYPIGLIDINLWEWPQGVGLYGMYQYYEETNDPDTFRFLRDWYDARMREGLPERNVNTTSPMITLMSLAERTKDPRYIALCDEWSRWVVDGLIRTGEGAFQHMITGDPNDGQILIDTLFMTVLFLVKAGVHFNRPEYVEEAKRQFLLHIKYLHDPKTGLFFHGWDFNGRHHYGAVRWGRGNGWYTCGVVDFLDMAPVEAGVRMFLVETFRTQVATLQGLQDASGLWRTVLDDPSSYLETSCTAAFGYGMLKGVRKGYLDPTFRETGRRALRAVLDQIDEGGIVRNVSYGTPVGNDADFYKNIPISPMTYGQALALLILMEGPWHL